MAIEVKMTFVQMRCMVDELLKSRTNAQWNVTYYAERIQDTEQKPFTKIPHPDRYQGDWYHYNQGMENLAALNEALAVFDFPAEQPKEPKTFEPKEPEQIAKDRHPQKGTPETD